MYWIDALARKGNPFHGRIPSVVLGSTAQLISGPGFLDISLVDLATYLVANVMSGAPVTASPSKTSTGVANSVDLVAADMIGGAAPFTGLRYRQPVFGIDVRVRANNNATIPALGFRFTGVGYDGGAIDATMNFGAPANNQTGYAFTFFAGIPFRNGIQSYSAFAIEDAWVGGGTPAVTTPLCDADVAGVPPAGVNVTYNLLTNMSAGALALRAWWARWQGLMHQRAIEGRAAMSAINAARGAKRIDWDSEEGQRVLQEVLNQSTAHLDLSE